MLARALRLSLLLEMALYLALARYAFDASPATAALAALAGVLCLRAALLTLTYAYAWAYHSPASRLSPQQALRWSLASTAPCCSPSS
jgi:hypothetical protein